MMGKTDANNEYLADTWYLEPLYIYCKNDYLNIHLKYSDVVP